MEELSEQYSTSKIKKQKNNYNKILPTLKMKSEKYWNKLKTLLILLKTNKINLKLSKN